MRSQLGARRAGRCPSRGRPSAGLRWLAIVCALVFSLVTTAQAAHLHAPATRGHHVQAPAVAGVPGADSEEHCPLCVFAIHAALPAPMHVGPAPVLLDEVAVAFTAKDGRLGVWHFARFGRPPPAWRNA